MPSCRGVKHVDVINMQLQKMAIRQKRNRTNIDFDIMQTLQSVGFNPPALFDFFV